MREIGSEFWDVPTKESENDLFPEFAQWFLCGRSALTAIIKELKGAGSVSLPSWCCESIIKPFSEAHYKIDFYPASIGDNAGKAIKTNADVLFIMDYFGYTSYSPDLSGYKGTVIRDVTHSLFSATYSDADYYFGSLRKWCGVWTGGYAWTKDGHKLETGKPCCEYIKIRKQAMEEKRKYIEGQGKSKEYLQLFNEAEEYLETAGIAPASERDSCLARKLDVERIKSSRKANAEILRSAFPDWLIFPEIKDTDCPMFVPVSVPGNKRDGLRLNLIKNEIYCPVHWPVSEYHKPDEKTARIYSNELSLVCDERYTTEDMKRTVEVITGFMRG